MESYRRTTRENKREKGGLMTSLCKSKQVFLIFLRFRLLSKVHTLFRALQKGAKRSKIKILILLVNREQDSLSTVTRRTDAKQKGDSFIFPSFLIGY